MYWEQRKDPNNWRDQIRYYTNHNNNLSESELRDAFIHLSHRYICEFINVRLLESAIMEAFGDKGEQFIDMATTQTDLAKKIADIDFNNGDARDILGITLNTLDFIENNDL